jgi:hypothetical protein
MISSKVTATRGHRFASTSGHGGPQQAVAYFETRKPAPSNPRESSVFPDPIPISSADFTHKFR